MATICGSSALNSFFILRSTNLMRYDLVNAITFSSSLTSDKALIMHPIVVMTLALKFYPSSSNEGVASQRLVRPVVSSSKQGKKEDSITEATSEISPKISSYILTNFELTADCSASTKALSRVQATDLMRLVLLEASSLAPADSFSSS